MRISRLNYQSRKNEGHQKFLWGLAFERANLAFTDNDYRSSDAALICCNWIASNIARKASQEHHYYQIGEAAFNDKAFIESKAGVEKACALFGEKYKQVRYHNLVRLGADILRSPMGDFPKATVLGGLIEYAKHAT